MELVGSSGLLLMAIENVIIIIADKVFRVLSRQ